MAGRVLLDQIWSTKGVDIDRILGYKIDHYILKKVKLAQMYHEAKDLGEEDSKIVGHPSFVNVSLELGRLEDIIFRISLAPLFNELGLLRLLNNYNPIRKLYLNTMNGIEVRNVETLAIERVDEMSEDDIYRSPFYHKGRIYVVHFYKIYALYFYKLKAIDISNGDIVTFDLDHVINRIVSIIGDVLYYEGSNYDLGSFNLVTLENHPDIAEDEEQSFSFDGEFLYTLRRSNDTLSKYNAKTLELLDTKVLPNPEKEERQYCQVIGNRAYLDCMNVYDLDTLELLAKLDIHKYDDISDIHSYDGKIYVLVSSILEGITIRVYEEKTLKFLRVMVTNIEKDNMDFRYILMYKAFENKIIVTSNGHIEIHDLDTGKISRIKLNHPNDYATYVIG
jgi:hypothetical protein